MQKNSEQDALKRQDMGKGIAIGMVLFLPFGIVGTWRAKSLQIQQGRAWLLRLLRLDGESKNEKRK